MNNETPGDTTLDHEEDACILRHSVKVLAGVRDEGEKTSGGREMMHACVSMMGAVSVSGGIDLKTNENLQVLRVNAASLFHSSERSYTEALISVSSAGRFSIPPIGSQTYVRLSDQMKHNR